MVARLVCWMVGSLFVGIGAVLFARGAQVDPYHNLLHIVTGIVALGAGFSRSSSAARTFCPGFGAFYLAFGGLGMLLGNPALDHQWQVGPMSLEEMDHGFHIVLGLV